MAFGIASFTVKYIDTDSIVKSRCKKSRISSTFVAAKPPFSHPYSHSTGREDFLALTMKYILTKYVINNRDRENNKYTGKSPSYPPSIEQRV